MNTPLPHIRRCDRSQQRPERRPIRRRGRVGSVRRFGAGRGYAAPGRVEPVPGPTRLASTLAFLTAAVRNPRRVGAIAPSSPRLAELLASVVPTGGQPVVIELGPGTGAVSSAIAARVPDGARHLAVELDPVMAAQLRLQRPTVEVIDGDAHDLSRLLVARDITGATAVIGGLPWSLFEADSQQQILQQIARAIGPDGAFTTFTYAHARPLAGARGFQRALEQIFDEVQVSRVVWRNLPPAYCYICRRPRAAA